MDNGTIWTNEARECIQDEVHAMLIWGPMSGTGKSTLPIKYAEEFGLPFGSITVHEGTQADELRGFQVYKGDAAGMMWQDGPMLQAWRASHDPAKRCIFVINEINRASDETLSFLLAALDEVGTAMMTLPTGERVSCGVNVTFVCTANEGPETFPEPLRERFQVTIEADTVAPEAIARLSPRFQAPAYQNITQGDDRARTIRQWFELDRLVTAKGRSVEVAARRVFGKARGAEIAADLQVASA